MEPGYFKDKLFELLNEGSDVLDIADIETDNKKHIFTIKTADGSLFEIACRGVWQNEKNGE